MSDNSKRVCHICGSYCLGFCVRCTAQLQNGELPDPATMTPYERKAELRQWDGILEVPFDLMWERIERLVGRDIYLSEFAFGGYEALIEEAEDKRLPPATLDDHFQNIPRDIKIIPLDLSDTSEDET